MAFDDAKIDLAQHAALIDKLYGLIIIQLYQELLLIYRSGCKQSHLDTLFKPLGSLRGRCDRLNYHQWKRGR